VLIAPRGRIVKKIFVDCRWKT